MKAARSRARLTARRSFGSLKGGLVWLMRILFTTPLPTSCTTMDGTAVLIWPAMLTVMSPGLAASIRPAWSARARVPRSVMIT
jgi:hypothetical protein